MIQDDNLYEEVGRYLGSLHYSLAAGELIEIRYRRPGLNAPMNRKFFSSVREAADWIYALGAEYEIYAGVAPRFGKDGTKAGVARVQAVWADLDLKDVQTHDSRRRQLNGLPYQPSILVWSGGGLHAYWLLKEAAEGSDSLEYAELLMRRLAQGLGGDAVHDRSRILRVPGTVNHKYDKPRPVSLEYCDPSVCYGLEELAEMAEALLSEHDGDCSKASGKVPHDILGGPICDGQRNVALASIAGSLRDRGLDAETMCTVLLEVNRLRCEPPLKQTEVLSVGRSVGKYPAGIPRYRRSSAKRIYPKGRR